MSGELQKSDQHILADRCMFQKPFDANDPRVRLELPVMRDEAQNALAVVVGDVNYRHPVT